MGATAEDLNQQHEERRFEAIAGQQGLNAHERALERRKYLVGLIVDKADEVRDIDKEAADIDLKMEELRAQKKKCNSKRKAIYDELNDEGVSHVEFMAVYQETQLEEQERAFRVASRAICYEAMNLKQGETADFIAILEANEQAAEDEQRAESDAETA